MARLDGGAPRGDVSRRRAVIVAARRTPITRAGGALRRLTVDVLAAPVLRAVLDDAGMAAEDVDEVILGNAAGPGGNPARLAALTAGFPVGVPGLTVDRQCGSGLEAVVLAARLIEAGAADVCIAGGVESASTAPWRLERPTRPTGAPRLYERARFSPELLGDPDMGVAAETVARRFAISRERQDRYALASHRKAVAAMREGRFRDEMVAMPGADGGSVTEDDGPRPDTTLERLAALPAAFVAGGTVTAGNACPINDGAAAVLLMSGERIQAARFRRGLGVVDAAAAGVDPNVLGIGPVASTRRLLARRPELSLAAVDVIEFNEAFAAQVLASLDALGLDALGPDEHRINVGGGAIALGHPWGASGAVLVVRLFTEMVRAPRPPVPRLGLAMLGIAGGLGLTALFEVA
jgi:acetyl-CoA C-acetyltransferase